MSLRARLGWLAALFLVQFLYFPINRLLLGGVVLYTALDPLIPVWPIWAIPYLLGWFWWVGCFFWAAFRMDGFLYRALIAGALFTLLTSYIFYIIYPTYVFRPELVGNGWQFDMLRSIYANDHVYNAFPSGHAYTSALIFLFWWRWKPGLRLLWGLIAGVVILSTLFTGQHHLLDPLGGILWAWLGYHFGLEWAGRTVEG